MKFLKPLPLLNLVIFLGLAFNRPGRAEAGFITDPVTVLGTAGPWLYAKGGLNSNLQYGVADNTAPSVVTASSGLSFAAGTKISVDYVSGRVSAGLRYPASDADGDMSYVTNGAVGNSGTHFVSYYLSQSQYPVYLGALVGAFADDSGAVVGTPFFVGNSTSLIVPIGATRLQLGINDDTYSDNTGSFAVNVSEVGPELVGSVPGPPSHLLLEAGLILALGVARRMAEIRICAAT